MQLGHLSTFYKYALENNMTCVHFETKQWHYILRYVSASFFQNTPDMHFSLRLDLNLVCETRGIHSPLLTT